MITYKSLIYNEEQIKNLYLDNQWYAYTNDIDSLFTGIKNSTECLVAYDQETLVGLIRTVSDKETICFIQDILVLNDYKRRGIGTRLMKVILDKYTRVRQIVLMTGTEEYQRLFYESLGFVIFKKSGTVGYTYNRK